MKVSNDAFPFTHFHFDLGFFLTFLFSFLISVSVAVDPFLFAFCLFSSLVRFFKAEPVNFVISKTLLLPYLPFPPIRLAHSQAPSTLIHSPSLTKYEVP